MSNVQCPMSMSIEYTWTLDIGHSSVPLLKEKAALRSRTAFFFTYSNEDDY